MTAESVILKACLRALQSHPVVAMSWRVNSGMANMGGRFVSFGMKGMSDILGILRNGQFLAIEVKTPTGIVSDAQKAFSARVRKSGGISLLVRSSGELLDDLDKLARQIPVASKTRHSIDAYPPNGQADGVR